jgi:hypothetical protein
MVILAYGYPIIHRPSRLLARVLVSPPFQAEADAL